jgi:hypothetical protein
MDIPDIEEVRKRTKENEDKYLESETLGIRHYINKAASEGKSQCTIKGFVTNLGKYLLMDKGYSVELTEGNTIIYWAE